MEFGVWVYCKLSEKVLRPHTYEGPTQWCALRRFLSPSGGSFASILGRQIRITAKKRGSSITIEQVFQAYWMKHGDIAIYAE